MKVMFISHSSVLEYHQQKLKILSEKYGVNIHLLTPPFWYEGGVKTEQFQGNKSINYHIGKVFMLKNRIFHFYFNAGQLVKKINPDIVHIEEIPFNLVCFQFIHAAKKLNKKVLFFTWENIRRKLNPLYNFFYHYSIKNSDCAIAGNKEGKEILYELGFQKKIYVLPQYGINLEDFKEKKDFFPGKGEKFNIAYIGRLVPEKGVHLLLEAIKDIDNINLILAGKGNSVYENFILELIKKYNLNEKVKIVGFIENRKIPDFLNNIHILVLPSITTPNWKEQFGRVIIEAFAARTVVIGSSSGEIPNVINDAGLIFKEGDSSDLNQKIKTLLTDKKLFYNLIEKGYKRVKEDYTNEIIAEKIYEIYKSLIGEK